MFLAFDWAVSKKINIKAENQDLIIYWKNSLKEGKQPYSHMQRLIIQEIVLISWPNPTCPSF